MFDVAAEAYNTGARAGLAELGALEDGDARRIAESTPNGRALDRLAHETIDRVTAPRRAWHISSPGWLRGVPGTVSPTHATCSFRVFIKPRKQVWLAGASITAGALSGKVRRGGGFASIVCTA
ncbi:hypothetical protein GCM10010211_46230 [Streptomyces albospinus]|uniref:Uncharacterized protein n=1 Tax=Streptomyces albospinus TaxID=285515 RepID=A0ABQ2VCX9_9ACTN|nr:hypothetical protein [Streptomyces albospinus]GGU75030.1 hypothetical protein GCM10010211_46230 [Streptomyces albospinus]